MSSLKIVVSSAYNNIRSFKNIYASSVAKSSTPDTFLEVRKCSRSFRNILNRNGVKFSCFQD